MTAQPVTDRVVPGRKEHVLVLMPTERDAERTRDLLDQHGTACVVCRDIAELCQEIESGVGCLLLTEACFRRQDARRLVAALSSQPSWSALPLIVLTKSGDDSIRDDLLAAGNVTLVEQPVRTRTLISAVRAALRGRRQQYDIRDSLFERERQAAALQESEARYRTLVEQVQDYAIFRTDNAGVATSWNEGVLRVLGFEEHEFIGRNLMTQIFTPEDVDRGIPQQELNHAALHGSAGNDRWMLRKDSARFFAMGTTTALRNQRGDLVGFTKVMRDVTDWKNASDALQKADRQKDEFLATLAHELRNPLAPISNSLDYLRTERTGPDVDRVLDIATTQVHHLVRLVDDLLEISRITQGKVQLRKTAVGLEVLLKNAVAASRQSIEEAHHQLTVEWPSEPLTLIADPVRITQVFANLLNNAAKYTDRAGEIRLSADREGDHAVIVVSDNGLGIPPSMLSRVFDLFTQVDSTLVRAHGGLGIGLTLVKNFVELHGGAIEARSTGIGQGSQFIVRLPLAASDLRSADEPVQDVRSGLPHRRILVVDDTRAAAFLLRKLLETLGQSVHAIHDARSALDFARTERPDIVLSDIAMPQIDGYELARRLRREAATHDLILVALTGYGQESDRQRALEAGFDHHLVKPVSLESLVNLLRSLPHKGGAPGWAGLQTGP